MIRPIFDRELGLFLGSLECGTEEAATIFFPWPEEPGKIDEICQFSKALQLGTFFENLKFDIFRNMSNRLDLPTFRFLR